MTAMQKVLQYMDELERNSDSHHVVIESIRSIIHEAGEDAASIASANKEARLEAEIASLRERLWEWRDRAKIFARRIRVIKQFQHKTSTAISAPYYSFLLKMELDKEMK